MPAAIVERFPFLTTVLGPGMHEAMGHQFLHLAAEGIMHGTFVNSINEMKRIACTKDHTSYLDHLSECLAKDLGFECFVPQSFACCNSPGKHNGTELKVSLLKNLFQRVMTTTEPCMQKSFQTARDKGASSDQTFKFAKMICCATGAGKHFHCSCTMPSLNGKINA
jgi:hypothetical protein